MTQISIIVAADENNAIGKDKDMLCHLPDDLKYFKATTAQYPIIMGRKTFESLPKGALPNRRNIVITRDADLQFTGCEMCDSLDAAIDMCKGEDEIFVIGGGSVYLQAMDRADMLYLTRIHHAFGEADTYFPEVDNKDWQEVRSEHHAADEKHKYSFTFLKYEKIRSQTSLLLSYP